jgi:phage replication O-like protein O
MRICKPCYFQTPNDLVDHWLPLLSEAELRVLLVVIRKTFGWQKTRDRISLSQMTHLTGMTRSGITGGVDGLIEKGIIKKEVIGENGAQESYYELIVHEPDSNKSDQSSKKTPPSLHSRPVYKEDPQKTAPNTINKKTTYRAPSAALAIPSPRSSKDVRCSSSWETQIRDVLKEEEVPDNSISAILRLKPSPTLDDIQTAILAAKEKPNYSEEPGKLIYVACRDKWDPKKTGDKEAESNKTYAQQTWMNAECPKGIIFECMNNHVEFYSNVAQMIPIEILYTERGFKTLLKEAMEKLKVIPRNT